MKRGLILLSLLIVGMATAVSLATAVSPEAPLPCVDGMAGPYPCHNVDLLAHLPLADLGGDGETVKGKDHWGWQDEATGRDFVLFGLSDGAAFVEITDRTAPVFLGTLPGRGSPSLWRDVKVYDHYAYVVRDEPSDPDLPAAAGLQIFDLHQLRNVAAPPQVFTDTAHYAGFDYAHNLWINQESGTAYLLRTDACPTLSILDLSDPLAPQAVGPDCINDDETIVDNIVSDAECVIYQGPDAAYAGREICFVGSDESVSILDVTDKDNPAILVDGVVYPENPVARLHQGTLTADQRTWLMSDVWDERDYGHNTRTYGWDVTDLDNPLYLGYYESHSPARDHNMYIAEGIIYQANWLSGLRVLDGRGAARMNLLQVGYFDVAPDQESPTNDGAWSNYPWWGDGVVTVGGSTEGLFVLQARPPAPLFLPFVR